VSTISSLLFYSLDLISLLLDVFAYVAPLRCFHLRQANSSETKRCTENSLSVVSDTYIRTPSRCPTLTVAFLKTVSGLDRHFPLFTVKVSINKKFSPDPIKGISDTRPYVTVGKFSAQNINSVHHDGSFLNDQNARFVVKQRQTLTIVNNFYLYTIVFAYYSIVNDNDDMIKAAMTF